MGMVTQSCPLPHSQGAEREESHAHDVPLKGKSSATYFFQPGPTLPLMHKSISELISRPILSPHDPIPSQKLHLEEDKASSIQPLGFHFISKPSHRAIGFKVSFLIRGQWGQTWRKQGRLPESECTILHEALQDELCMKSVCFWLPREALSGHFNKSG